jgi:mono/diheme cytochrome c family protein
VASSSSVSVNSVPTISFVSPVDGFAFTQGANQVAISASASDIDNNLSSVSLFIGDNLVSSIIAAPFSWPASSLNALEPGAHELRLVAEDALGETSEALRSVTVNAVANALPTVGFVSPSDGDVLTFGTSLNLQLTASDSDGQITFVEVFLNEQSLSQISQAPFNWQANNFSSLQNLAQGIYTLRALATDSDGGTSEREISISVLGENERPLLSFFAPARNLFLPPGSSLDVVVDAGDINIALGASLSIDGNSVGTDTFPESGRFFRWRAALAANLFLRNLSVGSHTLEVTGTDNNGTPVTLTNNFEVSSAAPLGAGDPAWGAKQYQEFCVVCHGSWGEGTDLGPQLAPSKVSYSSAGQIYSLDGYISNLMPKGTTGLPSSCVDQCARNIASYITGYLDLNYSAYSNLVGNATNGKVQYDAQCADCHGVRGVGGTTDIPLFPLDSSSNNYRFSTSYDTVTTDLFGVIELGMPIDPDTITVVPEGFADKCRGQCTADVIAYLEDLEPTLTAAERLTLQILSGKAYYELWCQGCHGADGRTDGIIPLTAAERNNNSLDNNDPLFVENRDEMPLGGPQACIGECATNVTIYIRERLDQ